MGELIEFERSDTKDLELLGLLAVVAQLEESETALVSTGDVYVAAEQSLAVLTPEPLQADEIIVARSAGAEYAREIAAVNSLLDGTAWGTKAKPSSGGAEAAQLRARRDLLVARYTVFAVASAPDSLDAMALSPKKFGRLTAIMDAIESIGGAPAAGPDSLDQEAARLGEQLATVYPFAQKRPDLSMQIR